MTLAACQEVPVGVLSALELRFDPALDRSRPPSRPPQPEGVPSPFERMQSDALAWRRAHHEAGDLQHAHQSYLRYLDFVGERRDGLHPPTPEERLGRSIAYFSDRRPTEREHRELLEIHGATGANPYDLALAWSVGWKPGGTTDSGLGNRPGEAALYALIEQVGASIAVTARMLVERTGLTVMQRDDHSSLAAVLGLSITGRCDCGHHVRSCTGCGRGCCFPDHDLRTWDPYRCHLRPFVDQAVRGTAQARILGGAFAEGMLFRALEREGRLLCRTVEWGRCDVCGRTFSGTYCPEPHPRASGSVRREPRKNQLVQPATEEGGHRPLRRWWCADCHHLFGAAGASSTEAPPCPRCARRPSRRMTVWARNPPTRSPVA